MMAESNQVETWDAEDRTQTVSLPFHETADGDRGGELALKRGTCLGRYMVLRALGSGGMGNVYSAYDPELDRRIALKVLRTDLMTSAARDAAHARLLQEAQIAARLLHPNVVTIHDVGSVGDRLFIAMEEIEGTTLREWLRGNRSWRDILQVFLLAGRGLSAAHATGLVHRDFKPSNVMVDRQRQVKVLDFGLAVAPPTSRHAVAAQNTMDRTANSRLHGTPAYMSPEQKAGQLVDARSDQFSFCVALYEALFGACPNPDNAIKSAPRSSTDHGPAFPSRIRRALQRGLSHHPAERFDTLEGLLDALALDSPWQRHKGSVIVLVGILTVLSILGWSKLDGDREHLCQGAERHLENIWDQPRKSEIERAFLATNKPYAADTWQRIETGIDTYTRAWTDLHSEACRATHLHGEQSTELLDRQVACLDQRLGEVRALSEVFREADARVVQNAVGAIETLTPLRGCADRPTLLSQTTPAIDPQIASEVQRGQERLTLARAFEVAGKYHRSLEMAQEAAALGQQLAYPRLIAEARVRIGVVHGRLGQLPAMRQNLLEAVTSALANDHPEALAQGLTSLIIHAYMEGEVEAARLWGNLAQAALDNRSGMENIYAEQQTFLGLVAQADKEHQRAIDHFQASMNIDPNLTSLELSALMNNIGISYQNLGTKEEALRFFRDAEVQIEKSAGREHPNMASVLDSQGSVLLELGALQEAEEVYRRSIRLFETVIAPDHPSIVYPLVGLGKTLAAAGRTREALEPLEKAVRVARKGKGDPLIFAMSLFELARSEQLSGLGSRTQEQIMEARTILSGLGERAEEELSAFDAWLANQKEMP